ncbi:MAG: DUF2142 domain-containing protein [Chloroflexi bacterium]|nr:DUF2142 domain-containing protein [Chloroflexota bacterium]
MMTTKTKNPARINPVVILFSTILVIGLLFCIFIPYGAGFDEEAHLVRVFDISGLNMVPNRGIENGNYTLSEFFSLSYQRRDFQGPAFDQFDASKFLVKANWKSMSDGTTRSHYFPANYLLQAVVAGVFWRFLDAPIMPSVILMKIIGFLFYLTACYLTFRMLPIGKWVFLVTALTPMALFLTGTINADVFTLACSFLFIGATLEYFSKRDQVSETYVPWKLAICVLLVGCTKPGTILVLLLLFILIRRHVRSKGTAILLAVAMVLSMAISIRWMMFSVDDSNFLLWTQQNTLSGQIKVALANLPDFLRYYFSGIVLSIKDYYTGVVGVYGYWVGQVPFIIYIFFPIALVSALLSEKKKELFNKKNTVLIILLGLMCLAEIAAFHFLAFYAPGTTNIDKVGRYFLPFLPLLFIPLAGRVEVKESFRKLMLELCVTLIIASAGVFGYGIYRTYYTDCVYAVNGKNPCVMPIYKNLDVSTPFVAHVTKVTEVEQSFIPKCQDLQSVKIRVETSMADPEDTLTMRILGDHLQLLATQEFLIDGLLKGDILELPTDIEVVPNGSVLWISLRMNSSNSDYADLGILGRKSGEKYLDGELFFNEEKQNADLFFQYTCQ